MDVLIEMGDQPIYHEFVKRMRVIPWNKFDKVQLNVLFILMVLNLIGTVVILWTK